MGLDPFRLLTSVSILVLCAPSGVIWAQPAAPPSVTAGARLPVPAASPTPIDFFRHLLAANPTERAELLAGKSAEHRRVLENSLRSYDNLQPQERELRLRTMELRYRLTPLLRMTATNRLDYLKLMPDKDRPILEERLRIWDQLSHEDQELLLVYEQTTRVLGSLARPLPRRDLPLSMQTSNQLRLIELQLVHFQSVPPQRRNKIQQDFNKIFELSTDTAKEHLQEYRPLSPAEVKEIEKSLERFSQLAPAQREQCLRNFQRFTDLSPSERREFLVSAQNWQRMKPADREAWRKLVSRMPPLPPRINYPPIPKPRLATATN